MQSPKFKSLISPPWPVTDKQSNDDAQQDKQHDQQNLSNFERNDQSEGNLDNIAFLGYN
jgi:hypothetical protein